MKKLLNITFSLIVCIIIVMLTQIGLEQCNGYAGLFKFIRLIGEYCFVHTLTRSILPAKFWEIT